QLLPEVEYTSELWSHWMVRVIDVAKALEARGYPRGVDVELHLDVADALLPDNAGRYVLAVEGGRGKVRRGGRGSIRLDVRGLAPLFTAHLPPQLLRVAGLVDAKDAELEKAALVFSGPAPWMPDGF